VTIDKNGVIELGVVDSGQPPGSGTLIGSTVTVENGGMLAGNGKVQASGEGLVISGGTLRPGFSVGRVDVTGNYTQESNGTLLVDGTGSANFDQVVVTGTATLDGTLQIDATSLAETPNTTIEIISAASVSGQFDSIEWTGQDLSDFYYEVYSGDGFALSSDRDADMNGDGSIPINSRDADLFVYALMNDVQKWKLECEECDGDLIPQHHGDFNDNGVVDFDDIAGFQALLPPSSNALAAAFDRYFGVPEPASGVLAAIWALAIGLASGRRRC
jgi:hypothetical protein